MAESKKAFLMKTYEIFINCMTDLDFPRDKANVFTVKHLMGYETIKLTPRTKVVEISLPDNGPGIPDDIKDIIFQTFCTTKATGEGIGLGLSLSYDIVTKGYGGSIEVESTDRKGTKFIIELPGKSKSL